MKTSQLKCTLKSRLFGSGPEWDVTSREFPYVVLNVPESFAELAGIYGGEEECLRRCVSMFDAHGTKGSARSIYAETLAAYDEMAVKAGCFRMIENPDFDPEAQEGPASHRRIPDPDKEAERRQIAEALALEIRQKFGADGPALSLGQSERATTPSVDDVEKAAQVLKLFLDGVVDFEALESLANQFGIELSNPPKLEELALVRKAKRLSERRDALADFGLR